MPDSTQNIASKYGHQLRVRACGILIRKNKILLVKHKGLGTEGIYHIPPGGGMQYNETAPQTLEREFQEETGMHIQTGSLLSVHEFYNTPLHALELFFEVSLTQGTVQQGHDPELNENNQIIESVIYMSFEKIRHDNPALYHPVVKNIADQEGTAGLPAYQLQQP